MVRKLSITLSLAAIGFLLNLRPVLLWQDIEVILGGVASLACAVLAGPYWAFACALIAFLPTLTLWAHPYGFIVLVLEAAAAGLLVQRKGTSLTAAVVIYWAIGGVWAYALLLANFVHTPPGLLWILLLMRPLNGVLAALFVELVLLFVPLQRYAGKSASRTLRHEMFILMAVFAVTPVAFLAYREGRWVESNFLADAQRQMELQKLLISERASSFMGLNTERIRGTVAYYQDAAVPDTYPKLANALFREIGSPLAEVHIATPGGCLFHEARDEEQARHDWVKDLARRHPLKEAELSRPFPLAPRLENGVASLWPLGGDKYLVTVWDLWDVMRVSLGYAPPLEFALFTRDDELLLSTVRQSSLEPEQLLQMVGRREGVQDLATLAPQGENVPLGKEDYPLAYYSDLLDLQWRLVMLWPKTAHTSARQSFYLSYVWLLFIGFGAALVFSLLASRKYHQPIGEVVSYAGKLAQGNFSAELETRSGIREVDTLVEGFRSLKESLERSQQEVQKSLQQLGEQKTALERAYAELKQSNAKLSETRSQLVQAERLASLGEMVRALAQELNNPLTAVIGFSELMLKYGGERSDKALQAILDHAQRCESIVKALLDFARQGEAVRRPTSLREVLEKVQTLRENQFRVHGIDFQVSIPENLPVLDADPQKLERVFVSLVNNAYDALAAQSREPRQLSIGAYQSGDSVYVVVSDTGIGIPASIRDRIFEPFFTTKPGGQGTGLGLSTVYGILQDHDAEIRCESEPGQGTQFFIRFPVPKETAGTEPTPPQRILVVDDEPAILDLITECLQPEGHSVQVCQSGNEALERLGAGATCDLLITDLWMPTLTGFELYERLRRMAAYRDLKVIFISGDADPEIRAKIKALPALFLAKPFSRKELLSTVAAAVRGL